jgi:hypothetical protein
MKNRALFLIVPLLASGSALAASDHYTATLAQPLDKKKELIVEHNVWRCEASTCILVSSPVDADSINSCRHLERQVGALTGYGATGKPFDDKKLATCNGAG